MLAELRALRCAALPQGDAHREQEVVTLPLAPAAGTKRAVMILLDHAYPAALALHRGLTSHLFVNMRRSAGSNTLGSRPRSTQVKPAAVVSDDKRDNNEAVIELAEPCTNSTTLLNL